MSRNLLIFGQGSMACHPYVRDEFYAISREDKMAFRKLFWQHVYYSIQNFAKAFCSAWTGGLFVEAPRNDLNFEYKRLTRLSHALAWLSDLSLMYLGGDLKRKERLSARLADGLSFLYMGMAVLRSYQENKENPDEKVHAKWALDYCFYQAQKSMIAFCRNFTSRPLGFLMRIIAFPFGQTMAYPSDKLDHQLAQLMMKNNHYRERMMKLLFLSGNPNQPIDRMENALQLIIQNDELYKKIADLKRYKFKALKAKLVEKVAKGELTQAEVDNIISVERACWDAIQVDEFAFDSVKKKSFASLADTFANPMD